MSRSLLASPLATLLAWVVVGAVSLALASGADLGRPAHRAVITDDGGSVQVATHDGHTLFRWTTEDFQSWAAPRFDELLATPPELAGRTLGARDFDRFGAASVAPDGTRAAFSLTSYAVLTTVSLIVHVDLDSNDVAMIRNAKFGQVEDPTWSPSGRYLAYALGTARAAGDTLAIDDVRTGRQTVHLGPEVLLDAWADSTGVAADAASARDGRPFLPHVRDLVWREGGMTLGFTTDPPARPGEPDGPTEPGVRWRVDADGGRPRPLDLP